jgi:hypothetical protein
MPLVAQPRDHGRFDAGRDTLSVLDATGLAADAGALSLLPVNGHSSLAAECAGRRAPRWRRGGHTAPPARVAERRSAGRRRDRLGPSGRHDPASSRRHEDRLSVSTPIKDPVGDTAGRDLGRVDDASQTPEVLLHRPVAIRDALAQTAAARPAPLAVDHAIEICPEREQMNRRSTEVAGTKDV